MSERRSAKPDVKLLGHEVRVAASPDKAILERVPNPQPDTTYVARFGCRRLPHSVRYGPAGFCPSGRRLCSRFLAAGKQVVEALSGILEDCTVSIGSRTAELIKPRNIRIGGYWYPRGGIPSEGSCNPGSMMFFCIPM